MRTLRSSLTFLCFGILTVMNLRAAQPPVNVQQLAELTPSVRAANDWFGISIAISDDTVVVGAFDANIEKFGTVYVYSKPPHGWKDMTQVAILTASDSGEGFGVSVAISGGTIVVGAANTSNFHAPAATPGAAYVFVRPQGGWKDATESAKLTASDAQPGNAFGNSVGINGNTIAVGSFFAPDASNNSFAGKAYVFVRPDAGWTGDLTETAKLTATDSQLLNYLGASVAINNDTVVAGASGHNNFQGAGYVFKMPPGGWADMTQTAELTASDGKGSGNLGFSASMSATVIVLGAPGAGQFKGAAYVYVEPQSGWGSMTETAKLHAANGVSGDSFGQAVSISKSQIIIGAPAATVGANAGQGAAYLFFKHKDGWRNSSHALELSAADGVANQAFGLSVGVNRSTIVSGAIGNQNPGAAYVFGLK